MNRRAPSKCLVLLGALVVALLTVNIVYWQDPWFWRRYVNFVGNVQNEGGLTPFDVVRGDNSYQLAVATEGTRSIASTALDEAVKYAQEFGSFTLLVIHREVIQLEWYADGWDRQRLTESQSMHKTLMGLGIALVLARRFAHIPCLGLRGLIHAGPDGSIDAFLDGLDPEFADELRQALASSEESRNEA